MLSYAIDHRPLDNQYILSISYCIQPTEAIYRVACEYTPFMNTLVYWTLFVDSAIAHSRVFHEQYPLSPYISRQLNM